MDALHTICQPIFSTREHAHLFRAQNAQSVKLGVKTTVWSLHTHTRPTKIPPSRLGIEGLALIPHPNPLFPTPPYIIQRQTATLSDLPNMESGTSHSHTTPHSTSNHPKPPLWTRPTSAQTHMDPTWTPPWTPRGPHVDPTRTPPNHLPNMEISNPTAAHTYPTPNSIPNHPSAPTYP